MDITREMSESKLHAPATLRNRNPILAVLQRILPQEGLVLETSSGSGEHATYFAPRLAHLVWQPTDIDPTACASIAAHVAAAGSENLLPPIELDVSWTKWPVENAAAIISVNMIHIAPWEACLGLLDGAARTLSGDNAVLYFYGPFKRGGKHTAPTNDAFDRSLRAQNSQWGIRDLNTITAEAKTRGLIPVEVIDMPSNNFSVIFSRSP